MIPEGARSGDGEHFADERLDALVLEMLLDSDDFVPGNALCDKLDLPRAELLKRIDSLRARGYSIFAFGSEKSSLTSPLRPKAFPEAEPSVNGVPPKRAKGARPRDDSGR